MCLRIRKTLWNKVFKPKYKLAKKDIPVYKILIHKRNGDWESPYQDYPYTLGVTMVSPLETLTRKSLNLELGLHAFRNINTVRRSLLYNATRHVVLKAIIPKASLYIKGVGGDIVSNQLIVSEEQVK